MAEYIERERIEKFFDGIYDCADLVFEPNDHCCAADDCSHCKWYETKNAIQKRILSIPAADVLPRDEAIKMGAELAAMHGSDATSQQLEEAYLKGVEDGMTRRDVRPVVKAQILDMRYVEEDGEWKCSRCGWQYTLCICGKDVTSKIHFCPNCGAPMEES